jgi:hypothetical protein
MLSWLKFLLFAVPLLSAIPLTPASAIPITVSFTASGFQAGAPADPVTGSIVYDAASTTAPPDSLTSIDLTIAGHAYSLAEVAFSSFSDTIIGSTTAGFPVVIGDINSFFIDWIASSITPVEFAYGCETGCSRAFTTFTFTQFSVTAAAAVPEPSSLTLLLAGVLGCCVSLHLVRRGATTPDDRYAG